MNRRHTQEGGEAVVARDDASGSASEAPAANLIERLQAQQKEAERYAREALSTTNRAYYSGIAADFGDAAREIERQRGDKDTAYLERNQVVAALASLFPSGISRTDIPGWLPEWHRCVYIDLPTGQASWHYHDSQHDLFAHLPTYTKPWDGHTTPEKYARLAAIRAAGVECSSDPNTRPDRHPSPTRAEMVEALRKINRTPSMPFPDPGAHSWEAWGRAVYRAWREIQNISRAILTKADSETHERED